MTKKLNKEQRVWVELVKASILNLQKTQDEGFDNLIESLLIEDESDINWIFDFIYNAGELSDDYYKFVENTIFE